MRPTLYLAGPMRGLPKLNWPAFEKATIQLREKGFKVVSPVELSVGAGMTYDSEPTPELLQTMFSLDTQAIIWQCDAIALLDGWHLSGGCKAEVALAEVLVMRQHPLKWWLLMPQADTDACGA